MKRAYQVLVGDKLASVHLTFFGAKKSAYRLSKEPRFEGREITVRYLVNLGKYNEV